MTEPGAFSGRENGRLDRWFPGIVALIVALAAAPRVIVALHTPLAFDEIYAVMLARTGLAGLIHTLAHDVDQPLHYILVWLWRMVGGEGERWIKVLPLIWSLATVALVAIMGRRLFGAAAGLGAAALLAVQPTHIFFSQQASFHAMVWCLLPLAFLCAWRWIERPSAPSAFGFVLAAAAAIYTDHFSYIVTGAIGLWGIVSLLRRPKQALAWLGLLAAVFALYIPQLPTLLVQWQRDVQGERSLPPLGIAEIMDMLRKLGMNATYLVVPLLILALLPLLRRESRRAAFAIWFVCVAGVLVPWALSTAGIHLYISRQMYFVFPFFCVLISAGLVGLRWKPVGYAILGLLVLFGARSWMSRKPSPESVELPRAVEYLKAHATQDDVVFCAETRALLFVIYHLPDRVQAKLLIMPKSEAFHYSDGILVVTPDRQVGFDEWNEWRKTHERWWGLRLQHAGRDGPEAAEAMSSAARDKITMERVTLWKGGAN
jgi:mannosyltransferase